MCVLLPLRTCCMYPLFLSLLDWHNKEKVILTATVENHGSIKTITTVTRDLPSHHHIYLDPLWQPWWGNRMCVLYTIDIFSPSPGVGYPLPRWGKARKGSIAYTAFQYGSCSQWGVCGGGVRRPAWCKYSNKANLAFLSLCPHCTDLPIALPLPAVTSAWGSQISTTTLPAAIPHPPH